MTAALTRRVVTTRWQTGAGGSSDGSDSTAGTREVSDERILHRQWQLGVAVRALTCQQPSECDERRPALPQPPHSRHDDMLGRVSNDAHSSTRRRGQAVCVEAQCSAPRHSSRHGRESCRHAMPRCSCADCAVCSVLALQSLVDEKRSGVLHRESRGRME